MASVAIISNLKAVIGDVTSRFELLRDREYLLRPLAIETIPLMKERIHEKGQASDGTPIGSYSNDYMRVREKYNRGDSRKIIVALTSQLENDWAVIATEKGYGIGFNNPYNADKMRWVEAAKSKIIANLSPAEKAYIKERLQELVDGAIG